MEGVITLIVIGLMIVQIIIFYSKKDGLSNEHNDYVSNLTPHRKLEKWEADKFKEIYKKVVIEGQKVYKISGPVDFISLSENDEDVFTVGKVMLSTKATKIIRKKLKKDLTELIPDLSQNRKVKEELDNFGKRVVDGVMDEEEVERKVNKILAPYRDHKMEFVFPDGMGKPAFPLYIGSQHYI